MQNPPTKPLVYVMAWFAAISGFLFGYDTGVISSAILFIQQDYGLSIPEVELIVGIVSFGAIIGAFLGGPLSDRFGRRSITILASILFIMSAFILAWAPNASVLVTGRTLVGIAIGLSCTTVPLYIAELAPPHSRGRLVALYQFALTIGILVAFLIGYALASERAWRLMFGLSAIPALIQLVGMLFLPESPRWLIAHGAKEKAKKVLLRLCSNVQEEEEEIEDITFNLKQENGGWRELFSPAVRPALLAGIGLTIVQQATGINSVLYYAPTIFRMAGFQSDASAILATMGVGAINVLITLLALRLIDRKGRKPLLYVGLTGIIISLGVLGIAFAFSKLASFTHWIAIISLMAYVASFAISLGAVSFLINSEIYPLKVRGKAMGLAICCNWGTNLVITSTFLTMAQALGTSGAFWVYALIGVIGLLFIIKFVPETKGKTLEQIESFWRSKSS